MFRPVDVESFRSQQCRWRSGLHSKRCLRVVLKSIFQPEVVLIFRKIPAWPFFGKPFFGTRQYCSVVYGDPLDQGLRLVAVIRKGQYRFIEVSSPTTPYSREKEQPVSHGLKIALIHSTADDRCWSYELERFSSFNVSPLTDGDTRKELEIKSLVWKALGVLNERLQGRLK